MGPEYRRADVTNDSPYDPLDPTGAGVFKEMGDLGDIRGGCVLDSMPVPCSLLRQQMESGATALEYTTYGPEGVRIEQRAIVALGLGLYGTEEPHLTPDDERKAGDPLFRLDWRNLVFSFLPQSPTREPITPRDLSTVRKNMMDLLKNPVCNKFIKGTLEELGKLPQGVYSTDIMDIFEAVSEQRNGGVFRSTDPSNQGSAVGSLELGNATIALRSLDGGTGLHETMHVAAKKGRDFGHEAMVQAAVASAQAMGIRVIGSPPKRGDFARDVEFNNANSYFFERIFFDACRKR